MGSTQRMKYASAISDALCESMDRDENIFVTGIAADYKSGLFGSTTEVIERFAPDRIFDAPSMENAMAGIAIGAAAVGKRPVILHPRADFMFLALDQLVNLASKWRYMYDGNAGDVPVVMRGVVGRGWGQGATHSQSIQSVIAHFPGINVIMPTYADDAKGLMMTALVENSPTVFLEHRLLFNLEADVPKREHFVPFGSARIVQEGDDVTVVASSFMTIESQVAIEALKSSGISVELIDLRSIRPLDVDTIITSVSKTGRLVVADTSWTFCGVAAEIVAAVTERAFASLKAPPIRLGMADVPAPVSLPLENAFYPKGKDIARAISTLMDAEGGEFDGIEFVHDFKGPY